MSANATESNVTETNATEADAAAPAAPAAPSLAAPRPHGRPRARPHDAGREGQGLQGHARGGTLAFMGRFKVLLVVVFAFAIGSTIFNIVGPKVLSERHHRAVLQRHRRKDRRLGRHRLRPRGCRSSCSRLGLYVLSAACSFVQGWIMSYVSQRTCYLLRRGIAEKIDRMPFGYFERTSTGDTLSRITDDVDTLGQSLNQGVTQLSRPTTTIVGVLIMMLSINPLMTLITVFILPVSAVLVMVVVKRSQKYFQAQQDTLGAINGQVEETFSGHAVVKAFGQEDATVERFNATNGRLVRVGVEVAVHQRPHAAHHELRGQPGLRGRGGGRQLLRRAGHHHRGRHPGVHPVREELHAAHHAYAGEQRAAADGRRSRAHLRLSGRAGRGSRPGERPHGRRRLYGGVRPRALRLRPGKARHQGLLGEGGARPRPSPSWAPRAPARPPW